MKSNYRRIGDYVREVKIRNKDLSITDLRGINIDKYFMPSVANTIGTDMSKYKVVKKGQFACNRMHVGRDKRLPVALHKENESIIVSPAYTVFEITDESVLDPEYLMMWFSRNEFDREAWFYTDSDVRGGLSLDDFFDIKIPLIPIKQQEEIVAEYNIIFNRIKLNEYMIGKLDEFLKLIYKRWFIDFDFPDENGEPYKSSGRNMEFNEELGYEIPENWQVKPFTKIVNISGGGTPDTTNQDYWDGEIPFFTPSDVSKGYYCIDTQKNITELGLKESSTKLYEKDTIFVTARGTVGAIILAGTSMAMNQSCYALTGENEYYIHQLTISLIEKLKNEANGAVFKALVTKDFDEQLIPEPQNELKVNFQNQVKNVYDLMLLKVNQNKKLDFWIQLLLSKLA